MGKEILDRRAYPPNQGSYFTRGLAAPGAPAGAMHRGLPPPEPPPERCTGGCRPRSPRRNRRALGRWGSRRGSVGRGLVVAARHVGQAGMSQPGAPSRRVAPQGRCLRQRPIETRRSSGPLPAATAPRQVADRIGRFAPDPVADLRTGPPNRDTAWVQSRAL